MPSLSDKRARMRMTVAYDGSGFHGFAHNEGVETVAGSIGDALERVLGHSVELACAGRTDRGVHAVGQVVSFDADLERTDAARIVRSVNRMCGPAIAVSHAEAVDDDFDARFSCTGRVYRYQVLNSPVCNPLMAGVSWHVEQQLDIRAMRTAADRLLGTHDFSSFCRRGKPEQSLERTVRRAMWWRGCGGAGFGDNGIAGFGGSGGAGFGGDDVLMFEVEARSFCHQMVRSMVALLVEVGLGRRKAAAVGEVMNARDRGCAVGPAPARGLVLWRALYD